MAKHSKTVNRRAHTKSPKKKTNTPLPPQSGTPAKSETLVITSELTERTLSSAAVPLDIYIALEEHRSLTGIVSHIIGEFWQTNAFFITFFSVVIVGILNYWRQFLDCPIGLSLIVVTLLLTLNITWFLTNVRHLMYSKIHMEHAKDLEGTIGFSVYTRRLEKVAGTHWPSARKIWLIVPLVFSLAIILIEIRKLFPQLFS